MKHPTELDLHDADKLRIDELEQQVLTLSVNLDNALDTLTQCAEELKEVNGRMRGLEK